MLGLLLKFALLFCILPYYIIIIMLTSLFMYFRVRKFFQGYESTECRLKFHELLEKKDMQVIFMIYVIIYF